jgi:rod shape-determining protein MreC
MFKRPQYIVLSGVALLALVIVGLPKQTAGQVKLALSSLFLPLTWLVGGTSKVGEKAGSMVLPRRALEAQLVAVRKENEQLKLQLVESSQLQRENAQLRAALGWQQRLPWTLKAARLVTRDPANWWRTAQVDAGSRDGVAVNMAVLTPEGHLVGRVDEVSFTASRIVMLGDPNCRVAVRVQETNDKGVIAPGSSTVLDYSLVELTYLPRNSTAKPGHRVYTSGASGFFPQGIYIGQIADMESVGQGLYMEARVKISADLPRVDVVWIVLSGGKS